jgi:hypothetical protein
MRTIAQIAFPNLTQFSDLFSEYKLWDNKDKNKNYSSINRENNSKISSYYIIDSVLENHKYFHSLSVQSTDIVIEYIKNNMLCIPDDSIYFRINIWNSKQSLVTAQYNLIIGSKWLAVIDTKSIPILDINI